MSDRIDEISKQRREDREDRERRLVERMRRAHIEYVARELGRSADSITDEDIQEHSRMISERHAAEDARRQALSPEERRQEAIESDKRNLMRHLKPQFSSGFSGEARLSHYPIFLLQKAPDSRNGATCRGISCTNRILPRDYRIAVSPGRNAYRSPGKTESLLDYSSTSEIRLSIDYYHVHCFEELLDLRSPHFVSRFEPAITKYPPDHGAQCILEECTRKWKSQIESANTEPDGWSIADGIWEQIRHASSRARQEVYLEYLRMNLIDAAPEADDSLSMPGSDWNITDYIPSESDPAYDARTLLSRALAEWKNDRRLVFSEITELSDEERIEREALGDAIQKIKNYGVVRMPNLRPFY